MIRVAITEVKNAIHISVWGHSGVKGESLQCAGASTLFAALSGSVKDRSDFVCESGYGYIVFPANKENKACAEMFRNGMELLSLQFPGEISVQ